ncbi:MAG: hypothetical protein U0269_36870 [Polyangiales bacterium]
MKLRSNALALLAMLSAACGEAPTTPDAEADRVPTDATDIQSPIDVATDTSAPREDARADATADSADAAMEAATDGSMDAPMDAATDGSMDSGADASFDAGADVLLDASSADSMMALDAARESSVLDVGTVGDAATDSASGSDASLGVAPQPSTLTASWYNGCAIRAGSVRCWGLGDDGQLGNGTLVASPSPSATVMLPAMADRVVSSLTHACARLINGEVYCWGNNSEGALGDGTTTTRSVPVRVTGVSDARHIATGINHSCAVLGTGAVQCWGYNNSGQIGDGTSTNRLTAVNVASMNTAAEVALGRAHSCARLATGTVQCWGSNADGQLGNGTTTSSTRPVAVMGLTDIVEIAAGGSTSCARNSVGNVWCWGRGDRGQRGDDSATTAGSRPVAVMNLARPALRITVGEAHSCALLDDGSTACWGGNDRGQFADGVGNTYLRATVLSFVRPAVHIAAGSFHTCAEHADRSVTCWGETSHNLAPVAIPGINAALLTAGYRHTCAVVGTTPYCWGANIYGELGDGTNVPHAAPARVVDGGFAFIGISAGNTHTCGITGGNVRCWGNNSTGQLGDGTMVAKNVPTLVSALSGVVTEVSSGYQSTCARRDDNTVWCWGANSYGELGDGTMMQRTSPVQVMGITDASRVSVGVGGYACAIRAGGAVWCWGRVPGLGMNAPMPVRIGTVTNVAEMALGYTSACLRLTSGVVQCFGSNFYGQLGDGTTLSHSLPAPVTGLTDAVELRSSANYVCARRMDNTVVCWGNNNGGMLGDRTITNRTTPVAVSMLGAVGGLAPAQLIAISSDGHTCAHRTVGPVFCWGQNWFGQLGRREINFTP